MDYSLFLSCEENELYVQYDFFPHRWDWPALLCQTEVYLTDPSHEKMDGPDFKVW